MATVQWSFSTRSSAYRWNHYLLASTPNATDGASDYEFYNFADKVNSIPAYSRIDRVIFWTRMGASIGSNEGYVKINGSGGTTFCEGSGGWDWFNLNAVNGFPYVNGDTSQINLASYCHSMTQDAGWLPNLYYYVSRQGSGLARNFSIELTITWEYTPPQFTVNVSAGEGGTVSGGGTTDCGGSRTITATPNTGYKFVKWSDGNTSASRAITCNNPTQFQTTYNLTAEFTPSVIKHTISTVASPSGGGTVVGAGTYEYGKTATLKATAADGYKFVKWNDGATAATRTLTVTGAATYTAYFVVDKVLCDTNKPTQIFIDTDEVKEVYIDTTKVYG